MYSSTLLLHSSTVPEVLLLSTQWPKAHNGSISASREDRRETARQWRRRLGHPASHRGTESTVLFVSLSLCPAHSRPRSPQAVEQALRHSFDRVAFGQQVTAEPTAQGVVRSIEVLQCHSAEPAPAAWRESSLLSSESCCAKVTICDHDHAADAVGRCHSQRRAALFKRGLRRVLQRLGPLIVEWWLDSARVTVVNVPISATEAEVAKAFSQWASS